MNANKVVQIKSVRKKYSQGKGAIRPYIDLYDKCQEKSSDPEELTRYDLWIHCLCQLSLNPASKYWKGIKHVLESKRSA